MAPLLQLDYTSRPCSTKIHMGTLFSPSFDDWLSALPQQIAIITDETVEKLYGHALENHLKERGFLATLFSFPSGEHSKNQETKSQLEGALIQSGFKRGGMILALGGGTVLDLASFIASTFMRGVSLAFIPTTLLAMVDACLGGKTAINTTQGKNLIGTFYPAHSIWIDTALLTALPQSLIKEGSSEIIKHALIADEALFSDLESEPLFWKTPSLLENIVARNLAIKGSIVRQDPYDQGIRRTLNFGHTIAHALERSSHYEITHGEAVGYGLLIESALTLDDAEIERIRTLMQKVGLRVELSKERFSASFFDALLYDKKNENDSVRFVLLEKIGKAHSFSEMYCAPVALSDVRNVLRQLCG